MADPVDIELVLDWVGTDADTTIIAEFLDRTDATVDSAALAFLRRRRAELLTGGLSWGIAGDYQEDATQTLSAIDATIGMLEGRTGGGMYRVTSAPIIGPGISR